MLLELRPEDLDGELELFADSGHTSDFFLVAHGGLKGTSNGILYRVIVNENRLLKKTSAATLLTTDLLQ